MCAFLFVCLFVCWCVCVCARAWVTDSLVCAQRPLEVIYKDAGGSPFVPLGVDIASLDRVKKWHFRPMNFREGQSISGGSIFGEARAAAAARPHCALSLSHTLTCALAQVYENELVPTHNIMCPPEMFGTVVAVYGAGTDGHEMFNLEVRARRGGGGGHGAAAAARLSGGVAQDTVLEIENGDTGKREKLTLSHFWPVRKPRPVAEKLQGRTALLTGQRVIDVLFPYARARRGAVCAREWRSLAARCWAARAPSPAPLAAARRASRRCAGL